MQEITSILPPNLFERLAEVRSTGGCNMLDRHCVAAALAALGYQNEANWVTTVDGKVYWNVMFEEFSEWLKLHPEAK